MRDHKIGHNLPPPRGQHGNLLIEGTGTAPGTKFLRPASSVSFPFGNSLLLLILPLSMTGLKHPQRAPVVSTSRQPDPGERFKSEGSAAFVRRLSTYLTACGTDKQSRQDGRTRNSLEDVLFLPLQVSYFRGNFDSRQTAVPCTLHVMAGLWHSAQEGTGRMHPSKIPSERDWSGFRAAQNSLQSGLRLDIERGPPARGRCLP